MPDDLNTAINFFQFTKYGRQESCFINFASLLVSSRHFCLYTQTLNVNKNLFASTGQSYLAERNQ